ncbi:MAG TPA: hypothetical protein VHB18_01085 [Mycobacteriales bacterium]|nr:hypothetical protein [Mycobacteriales bacterium]
MPESPRRPLRVHVVPAPFDRHRIATFIEPLSRSLSWLGTPSPFQESVAGAWRDVGPDVIVPTDLDQSDVAVLPYGLEPCGRDASLFEETKRLASAVERAGKLMLVFCLGDRELPSPGPNCVVFRTTARMGALGSKDVVMPAWVADPADKVALTFAPWSETPTVNFVGFAYPLGAEFANRRTAARQWSKAAIRSLATATGLASRLGVPPYYPHRLAAVAALQRAEGIKPDISLRQTMVRLDMDRDSDRDLHREFLERIAAADYTLSVRGRGNYSYRLYESLAIGRPVISVRSRDIRPCGQDVPWDVVSTDVSITDLPRLGSIVRTAHFNRRSNWQEVQHVCRQAWCDSLSAHGYFLRLVNRVTQLADASALSPEAIATALA